MGVCPEAWERGKWGWCDMKIWTHELSCDWQACQDKCRVNNYKTSWRVRFLIEIQWTIWNCYKQLFQLNMYIILTLCLRLLPHTAAGNYTKLIILILWCKLVALISLPAQGRCTCLSQKPWRFEEGRSWRRRSGQCWARAQRASKNSFTKVRKRNMDHS